MAIFHYMKKGEYQLVASSVKPVGRATSFLHMSSSRQGLNQWDILIGCQKAAGAGCVSCYIDRRSSNQDMITVLSKDLIIFI